MKLYALFVPVFFLIDFLWRGLSAKPLYDRHLGYLLRGKVLWLAAILFYLFFLLGLVVFVIAPAVESGSPAKAILLGLFFGFITYRTFELTNYALVRDWPLIVVIVDIAWGVVLSSLVSAVAFVLATKFFLVLISFGWRNISIFLSAALDSSCLHPYFVSLRIPFILRRRV